MLVLEGPRRGDCFMASFWYFSFLSNLYIYYIKSIESSGSEPGCILNLSVIHSIYSFIFVVMMAVSSRTLHSIHNR